MRLIVYGDFNCPYSYLASQRVDALKRLGLVEIEWRAVEHDRRLSLTGTPGDPRRARWDRDLAEVAALALPGEDAPAVVPPVISNSAAMTSAYVEAVTDAVEDEMRRALFRAVWVERRHLSNPYEVRSVVTGVTYPRPSPPRLLDAELPMPGSGHPDPHHMSRLLGGTVTCNGVPLTTTGWRRLNRWRAAWQDLPRQVVPTVVTPDGRLLPGAEGLAYLGDLLNPPAPDTAPSGTAPSTIERSPTFALAAAA